MTFVFSMDRVLNSAPRFVQSLSSTNAKNLVNLRKCVPKSTTNPIQCRHYAVGLSFINGPKSNLTKATKEAPHLLRSAKRKQPYMYPTSQQFTEKPDLSQAIDVPQVATLDDANRFLHSCYANHDPTKASYFQSLANQVIDQLKVASFAIDRKTIVHLGKLISKFPALSQTILDLVFNANVLHTPDSISYTRLLSPICHNKQMALAKLIVDKIASDDIVVDEILAMLCAVVYGLNGDIVKMMTIYQEQRKQGVLNDRSYGQILNVLRNTKNIEEVDMILRHMEEDGVPYSPVILIHAMNVYASTNSSEKFDEMDRRLALIANIHPLTLIDRVYLLSVMSKAIRVARCKALHHQFIAEGVTLDEGVIIPLIHAYSHTRNPELLEKLLSQEYKSHSKIRTINLLNSFLQGFCRLIFPERARELFNMSTHLDYDARTYVIMAHAYGVLSDYASLSSMERTVQKRGLTNPVLYTSILHAYATARDFKFAFENVNRIRREMVTSGNYGNGATLGVLALFYNSHRLDKDFYEVVDVMLRGVTTDRRAYFTILKLLQQRNEHELMDQIFGIMDQLGVDHSQYDWDLERPLFNHYQRLYEKIDRYGDMDSKSI